MKTKVLTCLKMFSIISFIGCLIGLFVGLYQLGLTYVLLGAKSLVDINNILFLCIYIFIIICLSILNHFILKHDQDLDGSGIPQTIKLLKNKGKFHNKLGILNVILSTYISAFSFMPLGSEAPSLILSSRIASLTLELFKVEDYETIKLSLGAGFGCAFLSPLTGLVFMFEHEKHLKLKTILKGLLLMSFSFLITYFINHHRLLEFSQFSVDLNMNFVYILIPICLITICFAMCFNVLLYYFKRIFTLNKNKFLIKYRSFFLFAVALVFAIVLNSGMGNGLESLKYVLTYSSLLYVFLLLVFRFFITILYGCGGVSGGLVVPTMVIGGLISNLIILVFSKCMNFDTSYTSFYMLIGMCLFFSLVNKRPLTGATLILSTLINILGFNLNLIPICFLIYVVFVVSCKIINKFMKHDIYGYLILAEQN